MSRVTDPAEVRYPMTNAELAEAIAVAFDMTQKVSGGSSIHGETVNHYYHLLHVQQQRASQYVTKADEPKVPT